MVEYLLCHFGDGGIISVILLLFLESLELLLKVESGVHNSSSLELNAFEKSRSHKNV